MILTFNFKLFEIQIQFRSHVNIQDLLIFLFNRQEMKAERKKECEEVIRKFEEIRMRGRKRTMVG